VSEFGEQWVALLRHRIQQGILDCALSTPNAMTPIKINVDDVVKNIDVQGGSFVSAKQGRVQKDVVVVADGCYASSTLSSFEARCTNVEKSKLIRSIAEEVPPLEGTVTAFRMEFDYAEVIKDDMLSKIYKDQDFGFVVLKMEQSETYILTCNVDK
jgi:hypothetical protein